MNEIRARFVLRGASVDPVEIEKAVGIMPTDERRRGVCGATVSTSVFGEVAQVDTVGNLHEVLSALVLPLYPKIETFAAAIGTLDLEAMISVKLTMRGDETAPTPSMRIGRDVIDFVWRIGGTLDIDIYRS